MLALVALGLGAPPVAGGAPFAPVTGKLDKPGYTVIALAASGEASAVLAPDGSFSLAPVAATVTLHLRAPDGTYAGPILPRERAGRVARARRAVSAARRAVTGKRRVVTSARRAVTKAKRMADSSRLRRATARLTKARAELRTARARLTRAKASLRNAEKQAAARRASAVTGVKAGAPLGEITVEATGYALRARLSTSLWKTWIDTGRTAQAINGVPIGAGNFGLVRSARTDGASVGDRDLDGVPDPLDVDDDGDLILDDADHAGGARVAALGDTFPDGSHIISTTSMPANQFATNANGGSTDEQIAAAQTATGTIQIGTTGIDAGSGELDCQGLGYCSVGGSGVAKTHDSNFRADGVRFPECCDPDGDGFGALGQFSTGVGVELFHGATIDQIGTGDLLILHANVNGVPIESATTVGFAFSTPPAFASYDDGQGAAGTFSYPAPDPPNPPSPVRAGPSGDVVLTLGFWRPQRARIPTEPGTGRWMDMGNLAYMLMPACPASTLSETDPNLAPTASSPYPGPFPDAGGLRDLSVDQPSDPANKLTFTVNLTQCLNSRGISFAPNDVVRLSLLVFANPGGFMGSTAVSEVAFQRQA